VVVLLTREQSDRTDAGRLHRLDEGVGGTVVRHRVFRGDPGRRQPGVLVGHGEDALVALHRVLLPRRDVVDQRAVDADPIHLLEEVLGLVDPAGLRAVETHADGLLVGLTDPDVAVVQRRRDHRAPSPGSFTDRRRRAGDSRRSGRWIARCVDPSPSNALVLDGTIPDRRPVGKS